MLSKGFFMKFSITLVEKIGDVWRGWGMLSFMVGLGIIT
jgi:hypothetical protein